MKTDLERFVELYETFGVTCDVKTYEDGDTSVSMDGTNPPYGGEQDSAFIVFDASGKFKSQSFTGGR